MFDPIELRSSSRSRKKAPENRLRVTKQMKES